MTVSTELSHEEYTGNGVTTDFDFRFRIFEAKHLVVTVANSLGDERILQNGTDYTLRGVGAYRGGKVILKSPLQTGWKIGIVRDLPAVQETDLRNQGKFFAEVHEDAFDYLTMLIQKALGTFSLSLRKPTYISNFYDAKGNRIANLGDPLKDNDVVNLKTLNQSIGAIDRRSLRVADKDIPALPNAVNRANKLLSFDNDGNPKMVLPESGSAADVLLELAKPTGSSHIGYKNSLTVEQELSLSIHGVKLSEYKNEKDPLNAALSESRKIKIPMIIDIDIEYETFIVSSNDHIYNFGNYKLIKKNNKTPDIEGSLQPERNGIISNFNVDAGIVIKHDNNQPAKNIVLYGINLVSRSHSEFALYAPVLAQSRVDGFIADGFIKGIRCKDAYTNQFNRIFCMYYYSKDDNQSDNICFDFSDNGKSSGTSNTFINVNCINYKNPFYFESHNYSSFINCGGENVLSKHTIDTSEDHPRVFNFVNCPSILINTPFVEGLHGSFIRFYSNNSSATYGACTITINNPQAITAVYGTKKNIGAKLFDIDGTSSAVINGGVFTAAASGYFLEFGGAKNDSYALFLGSKLDFVINSIRNSTELYNGVNSIKGLIELKSIFRGINSIISGVNGNRLVWKTTISDVFLMYNDGYFKVKLGGYYRITVIVPVSSVDLNGEVQILVTNTINEQGVILSQSYSLPVSGRNSVKLEYSGRLSSGSYLYVRSIGVNIKSIYDVDSQIRVELL